MVRGDESGDERGDESGDERGDAQDLLQELRVDLAAGEISRAEFEEAVKRQPSSPRNARRLSALL